MRQHLKHLAQRNPGLFNPIWPILYPVIRRRGGEIASEYDENFTALTTIHTENLLENPENATLLPHYQTFRTC